MGKGLGSNETDNGDSGRLASLMYLV